MRHGECRIHCCKIQQQLLVGKRAWHTHQGQWAIMSEWSLHAQRQPTSKSLFPGGRWPPFGVFCSQLSLSVPCASSAQLLGLCQWGSRPQQPVLFLGSTALSPAALQTKAWLSSLCGESVPWGVSPRGGQGCLDFAHLSLLLRHRSGGQSAGNRLTQNVPFSNENFSTQAGDVLQNGFSPFSECCSLPEGPRSGKSAGGTFSCLLTGSLCCLWGGGP